MTYLGKRQALLKPVLDKRAQLEAQLSVTKQALDTEEAKLAEVGSIRQKAQEDLAAIELDLRLMDGSMLKLDKDHDTLIEARQTLLHRYDELLDDYVQGFKDAEFGLERLRYEVQKLTTALDERQEIMNKESARLQAKSADLNIYQDRLQKRINEAGLNHQIKLIFRE